MNLFLDLEDTIIDHFDSKIFLHEKVNKIKLLISEIEKSKNQKFKTLSIFSAAITNDKNIEKFNFLYADFIEKEFKLKVEFIFKFDRKTLIDLIRLENKSVQIFNHDHIPDIIWRNEKEDVFIWFCKHFRKGQINVLFDDIVETTESNFHLSETGNITENTTTVLTIKV